MIKNFRTQFFCFVPNVDQFHFFWPDVTPSVLEWVKFHTLIVQYETNETNFQMHTHERIPILETIFQVELQK